MLTQESLLRRRATLVQKAEELAQARVEAEAHLAQVNSLQIGVGAQLLQLDSLLKESEAAEQEALTLAEYIGKVEALVAVENTSDPAQPAQLTLPL